MAKDQKAIQAKQKELVNEMLISKAPSMVTKALNFINEHFDSEDVALRRDAHKLYNKWFEQLIPKTTIIENKNELQIVDRRFEEFLTYNSNKTLKEIDVVDAEVMDEEEALNIRRIGSKKDVN
jgi:hypothetical protein